MIDLRYGRDVLEALREIPDGVVQCCVTSPPYYGLRDYKVAGQIGLEPTLDEFLARLVAVFREVRRVLHPTGIAWVNMGDSYAGSWGNYGGQNRGNGSQRPIGNGSQVDNPAYDGLESFRPPTASTQSVPPKALLNVPYRLAFALADDGWLHRDTVIWHKPAPMPESVRDRCTKAWEPIFMFTRQPRYFADMEGVKQRFADARCGNPGGGGRYSALSGRHDQGALSTGVWNADRAANGANLRNVWRMASERYKGAHFATFPSELPRRCLKIGTSPRGCCPTCRAPWVRAMATGWQQSCRCPAAEPIPCTVLDPFCGSGTTMRVAAELGLDGIGIDLNHDYLPLARERVGALNLEAA